MNLIKLSGIIKTIEYIDGEEYLRMVLQVPTRMKTFSGDEIVPVYRDISFFIDNNDIMLCSVIDVGNYFEMSGEVRGNSRYPNILYIYPKSVRGGINHVMAK